MWHAWRKGEVFTVFWFGGPKVGVYWEDQSMELREIGTDGANGFGWLRIGSSGGLL
jgi:hypothetical protein